MSCGSSSRLWSGSGATAATAVSVRRIRPLTLILFAVAAVLLVIGVVFFASSHPLRGGLLVVLAVVSAIGAWFSRYSSRTARPR